MADFPIQYSQRLPSGRSTAAPITADVAAPSRALSQAGGVLAQFGQKIQQAEDAMEFSTLKRQSEEIWNAAYNTMLSTPDPESRAKVYEKAKKDMSGLSAKSRRVQDKFQMHLNNALPQYDVYAADLDRKKRIQSAKAELETNGKYYLENGDLLGYQSLLKDGLDTGLLEEAEYQYMQENAETNSKFAQVRVLMDSNPQMAVQILDSMPDLTGEQLDQKDKLVGHARTLLNWREQQSDNKEVEVILGMHENLDKSPPERIRLGEQYINQLRQSGITPERAGVMIDRIESWQQGKRFETDPIIKSHLFENALDIWRGGTDPALFQQELKKAWNEGKINESDYNSIYETATRTLKTSQAGALADAVSSTKNVIVDVAGDLDFAEFVKSLKSTKDKDKALQKRQLQFWWLSQYEAEMQDWLQSHPDTGPMEFRQQAEKLRYEYMSWSDEDIERKLKMRQMKIKQESPKFEIGEERIIDGKSYWYLGNGKWDDRQ